MHRDDRQRSQRCSKCGRWFPSGHKLHEHLRLKHDVPGFHRRGRVGRETRQLKRAHLHAKPGASKPRPVQQRHRVLINSAPAGASAHQLEAAGPDHRMARPQKAASSQTDGTASAMAPAAPAMAPASPAMATTSPAMAATSSGMASTSPEMAPPPAMASAAPEKAPGSRENATDSPAMASESPAMASAAHEPPAAQERNMHRACAQCRQLRSDGRVDSSDSIFYCSACWSSYDSRHQRNRHGRRRR